jgi:hypothetical protein
MPHSELGRRIERQVHKRVEDVEIGKDGKLGELFRRRGITNLCCRPRQVRPEANAGVTQDHSVAAPFGARGFFTSNTIVKEQCGSQGRRRVAWLLDEGNQVCAMVEANHW